MKRSIFIVGILLLVVILAALSGCDSLSAPSAPENVSESQETGIWVTGEGSVLVKPDLAVLTLGVEVVAESVADAFYEANMAMAEINTAIIHEADLQTGAFTISQLTDYQPDGTRIITGYRVTNTVTAKIRVELVQSVTLDYKVSNIIVAAVSAGGDYIRINGLTFTVEDPSAYYDEACQEAAADAEAKAEKLAEEFGVDLGQPTYINESVATPYVDSLGYAVSAVESAASVPISIDEIEITVYVQVAYSINY